MKRLHVHVSVADLQQSIRFYSALFATEPEFREPDYAKWMRDDPRLKFVLSALDGSGMIPLPFELKKVLGPCE